MQTTSETILLITIWGLTAIGMFFGTRAKIRKRRLAKKEAQQALEKNVHDL